MREADIIVVGGGPAGVSAAIEAAKSGLSVMLCEQRPALGGAIHRQPAEGATPLPSYRHLGAAGRPCLRSFPPRAWMFGRAAHSSASTAQAPC